MNDHLKQLIRQGFNGSLPPDGRQELRDLLAQTDDAVLEDVLSGIWMEYEGSVPVKMDIDELMKGLQVTPARTSSRTLRLALRIAASILLPLLLGTSIFYYVKERKWASLAASTINIESKNGGKTNIMLPDGSLVALRSGTALSYPASFGSDKRTVSVKGEAYFEVAKNEEVPFYVVTDLLTIEVLGTTFNVNAYDGADSVATSLVEGAVRLTTHEATPRTVILQPNEKAVYHKTSKKLSISRIDAVQEAAWTRDVLVFKSAKFPDVMKKLEQQYHVTIKMEGDRYNNDTFTGTFGEENIDAILSALKLHYNFSYTKSNGVITVRFK
ncbi:FecR family protein [Chitinophaga eiseniae]|uniref:FecR family protein n=1 Tax=Chitinophaga eiseniae TaxID=634771 RepID=A0A847STN4_9BACT|nr:FecR family protein [Chitinophaga eiseniae]NLR81096.1 FecR family protein [Chitinophaga eiseniae]